MQGDLISREYTVKALREYAEQKHAVGQTELANGILKAVNFLQKEENVPTAYDVEKVVAELKEELKKANEEKRRCASENPLQFDTVKGYATGIRNALDIVCNDKKE